MDDIGQVARKAEVPGARTCTSCKGDGGRHRVQEAPAIEKVQAAFALGGGSLDRLRYCLPNDVQGQLHRAMISSNGVTGGCEAGGKNDRSADTESLSPSWHLRAH